MFSVIPLFLEHFDREPAPSGAFSSILPRLLPHYSKWADGKLKWQVSIYSLYFQPSTKLFSAPFGDTTIRVGELGEDSENNSFTAHGAILSVAFPYFNQHIMQVGDKFRLTLPSLNENATTPGALNLDVARSLVLSSYIGTNNVFISPANALLFSTVAPWYGIQTEFNTFCTDRFLTAMDLNEMVEVVAMACKLDLFGGSANQAIQDRLQSLIHSLHAHAASAATFDAWYSIDLDIRQQIMSERSSVPEIEAPLPLQTYPIFVRAVGEKPVTLAVKTTTCVEDLKATIYTTDGIPAAHQSLIFAGKQLENGTSLGDYAIVPLSTIHLAMRLGWG